MARILIVEPDKKLGHLYSKALASAGHIVTVRMTAQTAITAADEARPDAVVLELQLVNHSGIEFLYEFRSYIDWRPIPVIVVSHVPAAVFAQSSRLLTDRLGVRAYYYKPEMTLARLRQAVATQLVSV